MLSAIPERDAIGQFALHAASIRKVFGVRPTGAWLPHGVWEPTLPRILAAANLKFAIVTDRALEAAGVAPGRAAGVYRTEREGQGVALLPRDTIAQDLTGNPSARDLLAHLTARQAAGDPLVTLGLHAAPFGQHPGDPPHADAAWLAAVLAGIAQARGVLEARLPAQAVALGEDQGRIYLPVAAPFGAPPPWERTLVRYRSADRLHKKMLRVSRLVEKLDRYAEDESVRRPDPGQIEQARRYLYRAQTAAPYSHTPHAGLYDPQIRERAWRDVLRGEHTALAALGAADRLIVERADLDADGTEEILLYTPDVAAVVAPFGGALTELSPVGLARNLVDVADRVVEPYHATLPADDPRRALLGTDRWPRSLFRDRFLEPGATPEQVVAGTAAERATGLADRLWEVVAAERHGTDAVRAILQRDATVADASGSVRVRVEKRYTLRGRVISYREELTHRGREVLRVRHAVVLDLFLGGDASTWGVRVADQVGGAREPADRGTAEIVRLEAPGFAISLNLLQPARIWHFPIRTVHQSLGAWHTTVQGLSLWLVRDLAVEPGRKARFDGKLKIET